MREMRERYRALIKRALVQVSVRIYYKSGIKLHEMVMIEKERKLFTES